MLVVEPSAGGGGESAKGGFRPDSPRAFTIAAFLSRKSSRVDPKASTAAGVGLSTAEGGSLNGREWESQRQRVGVSVAEYPTLYG